MRQDRLRLQDIEEAILRIQKYAAQGEEVFQNDELIQTWIVHHLQLIGEACRALAPDFRDRHPEVPWNQIIGMRHILVHHYFGIDTSAVWTAATRDLPILKTQVVAMLDQEAIEAEESNP